MDRKTIAMMGFFGTTIGIGIGLECYAAYEAFQNQDASLVYRTATYLYNTAGGAIKGALVGITLPLLLYVPSLFQRKIHDEDERTQESDLENKTEEA